MNGGRTRYTELVARITGRLRRKHNESKGRREVRVSGREENVKDRVEVQRGRMSGEDMEEEW